MHLDLDTLLKRENHHVLPSSNTIQNTEPKKVFGCLSSFVSNKFLFNDGIQEKSNASPLFLPIVIWQLYFFFLETLTE